MPVPQRMLVVFGGLPGTGKTTLSLALSARLGATYLRIDTIEQAIRTAGVEQVGPMGYAVANAVAEANLRLDLAVVADCVNPVAESREAWRQVAVRTLAPLIEIEVICSDPVEHRRRLEERSADIPGHVLPTWDAVLGHHFEPWDSDRIVLDTAVMPVADAVRHVESVIGALPYSLPASTRASAGDHPQPWR